MRKYRKLAALCAAFVLMLSFSTVAYAGGGEEIPEEPAVTESAVEETNPFTPAGTGTVIDNATDGDGKEFYTIMTPNENVFYLIIDRQREAENVYFLNAVTERDLLALAEQSGDEVENVSAIPDTQTTPDPEPEPVPEPEPEPEKSGGGGGIIIVVLIVLIAGGAGYYFKIYRPKQQQADTGDEYEAGDDYGEYEGEDTYGEDAEDDTPPWDEDEDYSGDGEA